MPREIPTVNPATAAQPLPHARTFIECNGTATRFRVENRGDVGRNRVALHIAADQPGETVVMLDMQSAGDLYCELRRFMGELGGAGASRNEARRAVRVAIDRLKAASAPAEPKAPANTELRFDTAEPYGVPIAEGDDDGMDAPAVVTRR